MEAVTDIGGADEDDEARVAVVLDLGKLRRAALLQHLPLRPAPPPGLHHQRAPRRLPPRRRPEDEAPGHVDGRQLPDARRPLRRRRSQRHAAHHLHVCCHAAWRCASLDGAGEDKASVFVVRS